MCFDLLTYLLTYIVCDFATSRLQDITRIVQERLTLLYSYELLHSIVAMNLELCVLAYQVAVTNTTTTTITTRLPCIDTEVKRSKVKGQRHTATKNIMVARLLVTYTTTAVCWLLPAWFYMSIRLHMFSSYVVPSLTIENRCR